MSLAYFLATCKVNYSHFCWFRASIFEITLMQGQYKCHVWPRRNIIHIRKSNHSITDSFFEYFHRLLGRRHVLFSNILNIHAFGLIFSYFQIIFAWFKKISNLLHVDLNHTNFYSKLDEIRAFSNSLEYRADASWKKSFIVNIFTIWSDTCISFSWRSLTICKDSSIDSLESWINNGFPNLFEYFCLSGLNLKNMIKPKIKILIFISLFIFDWYFLIAEGENKSRRRFFILIWSDSDKYSDFILFHRLL